MMLQAENDYSSLKKNSFNLNHLSNLVFLYYTKIVQVFLRLKTKKNPLLFKDKAKCIVLGNYLLPTKFNFCQLKGFLFSKLGIQCLSAKKVA